jgi:ribonuclease R/exosome complex exonuclease DIS3/RRP44
MLLANKQVASFAGNRKAPLPFVYRIHDEPDADKLNNLQMVVSSLGYKLDLKTKDVSKSLNVLLSDIQGKQEQNLIDTLTIRCMSKAEYNVDNIGHYGLAFNFYSHFTSPIRRYPDVMVHRLLEQHLAKQKVKDPDKIQAACVHSSQREMIATKAERDSIKFMQIKFMEDKVGKVFEGVISGVTDRGIYVELVDNKCEGMVRIKDIAGDFFNFDDKTHTLIGERSKRRYQLGDSINVSVLKADLIKRHLDFKLEESNLN